MFECSQHGLHNDIVVCFGRESDQGGGGGRAWQTDLKPGREQDIRQDVCGKMGEMNDGSLWLSASVSHLEHVFVEVCHRVAGHQVGIALAVRLPRDGGLSLGLLWHCRVVERRDSDGHVHLEDGQPAALGVRLRQDDERLAELPVGRLRVADVSVVSIVVVLCVLHMLALTPAAILTTVARQLDSVVVHVSHVRHVKVATRAPG